MVPSPHTPPEAFEDGYSARAALDFIQFSSGFRVFLRLYKILWFHIDLWELTWQP